MTARIAAAAAAAALVVVAPAYAGLQRDARLGNNTEGATAITNGPNAGQVGVIDGWDVVAIPIDGKGRDAHKLFDVKSVPWSAFASGIAYIPTERTYLFDDQGDFSTIQAVRDDGTVLPARTVTYLPGFDTDTLFATEGMTYLPNGSPWPDSFARALTLTFDGGVTLVPDIEILARDGTVEQEIEIPGLPQDDAYLSGVTYLGADTFAVTTANSHLWRIGVDGTVLGPAVTVRDANEIEGLASFADGRVYTADYTAGKLLALDRDLTRVPARDRHFEIGVGVSRSFDGFWDTSTGTWVLLGIDRDQSTIVASVSPALDSRQVLFHPAGFVSGLTASPGSTVSMCRFGATGVQTYTRGGTPVGFLNFATVPGMPVRRCSFLTYLGSIDAFAVKLPGFANRTKVFLVSRSGTLLGVISTPDTIGALSSPPENPNALLVWEGDVLETYDATTQALVSTQILATTPLVFPFGFIAGPAGSYALLDGNNSEFAVFTP